MDPLSRIHGRVAWNVPELLWNVPERTTKYIYAICTTVEQNVPERTTLSLNQGKVRVERTGTVLERTRAYHKNIKHARKQVITYWNFSGTYQNVSQNTKPTVERTRTDQNPIELLQ